MSANIILVVGLPAFRFSWSSPLPCPLFRGSCCLLGPLHHRAARLRTCLWSNARLKSKVSLVDGDRVEWEERVSESERESEREREGEGGGGVEGRERRVVNRRGYSKQGTISWTHLSLSLPLQKSARKPFLALLLTFLAFTFFISYKSENNYAFSIQLLYSY